MVKIYRKNDVKRPVILTIFSLVVLGSTLLWFGKLMINFETLTSQNNYIYSFTKLGALISSIGMLLLRKWGVYLYAATYITTCILFFILDQSVEFPGNQQNIMVGIVITVTTIFLIVLFKKNWNNLK